MTDFNKINKTLVSSSVNKSFSGTKENGPEVNGAPQANINVSISPDSEEAQIVCNMVSQGKDINEIARETGIAMGRIKAIKAKHSK